MKMRMKRIGYGLVCFLAGAGLVLVAGTSGVEEPPAGRYQVSASNTGAFVIDTQTGHLWGRSDISAVVYDLGTPDQPTYKLVLP